MFQYIGINEPLRENIQCNDHIWINPGECRVCSSNMDKNCNTMFLFCLTIFSKIVSCISMKKVGQIWLAM